MTIKAVYEHGVFKPSEPVELLEGTPVDVVVPELSKAPDPTQAAAAFAKIAELGDPSKEPKDGLCGSRDHDAILYGTHKDRR
jgi:predicted DNA-binding antitoxin AbrB/MazE fold protein